MFLKKWDELPDCMKNDSVKVYYDILEKKKVYSISGWATLHPLLLHTHLHTLRLVLSLPETTCALSLLSNLLQIGWTIFNRQNEKIFRNDATLMRNGNTRAYKKLRQSSAPLLPCCKSVNFSLLLSLSPNVEIINF